MALSIEKRTQRAAVKLLKFFGKDGKNWIKDHSSQDKDGGFVPPNSRHAVKFCLVGAIAKLRISGEVVHALELRVDSTKSLSLAGFNDSHRTYTHVRRFLEKAAKG